MNQHKGIATTTDAGAPVASDGHSLTIGPDGPILLHDNYLIEQMANFNRERTPERQPHAKGSGAFGYFEVSADVRTYTRAAAFPRHRRKSDQGVGRGSWLEHGGAGVGAHVASHLEMAECTGTLGVRLTFRDPLPVEVRHLFDQVVVVQQNGAVRTDRQ